MGVGVDERVEEKRKKHTKKMKQIHKAQWVTTTNLLSSIAQLITGACAHDRCVL